jgi:hypothetical protein
VFAEDYCRTAPVYPPGTQIVVPREVQPFDENGSPISRTSNGNLGTVSVWTPVPAGTLLEIIGPFVEHGVCDWWPVRYQTEEGVEQEAYVDEWAIAPEFPNRVVPLPPERQFLTREMEEFCRSNPTYSEGTVMVLTEEVPLFSHRRGYGFSLSVMLIPSGAEIEITGSPVETGICDMWPVTYAAGGPITIADYEPHYIYESDLQTASASMEADSG